MYSTLLDTHIVESRHSAVSEAEHALDACGVEVPVPSRAAWRRHLGSQDDRHVLALDGDRRCVGSLALAVSPTRAFPGHRIARIASIGDAYASPTGRTLLTEATRYAGEHGRILRMIVELECRQSANRQYLRSVLLGLGYRQIEPDAIPERTVVADLTDSEDAIFARFSTSTRRNVRGAKKCGLEVALLDREDYAARLTDLHDQTMARTGGRAGDVNWRAIIRTGMEIPLHVRMVGVFRGADRAPVSLMAFMLALHHGSRAQYLMGGSARIPGDRSPLLYPAMWDVMQWAKRVGATWFDFGGVTAADAPAHDAFAGISQFKRGFSNEEIALGEEWLYDASGLKSWVANAVTHVADSVRELHARCAVGAAPD